MNFMVVYPSWYGNPFDVPRFASGVCTIAWQCAVLSARAKISRKASPCQPYAGRTEVLP